MFVHGTAAFIFEHVILESNHLIYTNVIIERPFAGLQPTDRVDEIRISTWNFNCSWARGSETCAFCITDILNAPNDGSESFSDDTSDDELSETYIPVASGIATTN